MGNYGWIPVYTVHVVSGTLKFGLKCVIFRHFVEADFFFGQEQLSQYPENTYSVFDLIFSPMMPCKFFSLLLVFHLIFL